MGRFVLVALDRCGPSISRPFIWMVVAWHRFVLAGRASDSLLPAFNGRQCWLVRGARSCVGFALLPIFYRWPSDFHP